MKNRTPKRFKHDLSHSFKCSGNLGELLPIACYDILPLDSVRQSNSALVRLAPLEAPLMHKMDVKIHSYFVPLRLIWKDSGSNDGFEDFITGGSDGNDSTTHPYMDLTSNATQRGELLNYLFSPAGATDSDYNILYARAYQLIYNEHYRNIDLQTENVIDTTSGADTTTDITLQYANWDKDYFTTSKPWEQKGDAVSIPLGTSADILYGTNINGTSTANDKYVIVEDGSDNEMRYGNTKGGTIVGDITGDHNLYADLTNATAATVTQLREAIALQRYKEARALYGDRYVDYLRYLGATPSDARLQRPEYLGGGKQAMNISEIIQTAPTTSGDDAGVGDLKGHGITALRSNTWQKFFNEHGIVMTLMSVIPEAVYTQGVPKNAFRSTKEEYFQKELQHIGQEEIQNREVYYAHTTPSGTFGYQDRYDEYRSIPSRAVAEFENGGEYANWTLGRIFASDPSLNDTFLKCNPSTRIFADTNATQLQITCWNSIRSRRIVHPNGKPMGVL